MDRIWYKEYDPDIPQTINPEQYTSYIEVIEEMFAKYPNIPFFTNFGSHLTFKEVDVLSQNFAGYLQSECGCVKGDRITMLMLNTLQHPIAIIGALRAGVIIVGVTPTIKAKELHQILNKTEPKCILILSNLGSILQDAFSIGPIPSIKHIILTDVGDLLGFFKGTLINLISKHKTKNKPFDFPDHIPFKKTIQRRYHKIFIKPSINENDIAFLDHTDARDSATPKCLPLTHRNIVAQHLQLKAWVSPAFKKIVSGQFLVLMPIFHTTVLIATMVSCSNGHPSCLITNPMDINGIFQELKNHEYFGTICISKLLKRLISHKKIKKINFSTFEFIAGWGDFYSIDVIRLLSITGKVLTNGYGSREMQACIINPVSLKNFNNKVGMPLPSVEAKICDENGNELPPNTRGELWVKGPQVIKEYWKDPDLTKHSFTKNGWFKSGDILIMDDRGYFTFIDRKSDLITINEKNIYPKDVESVLTFMKGIKEVNIVSKKIENKQIIKAFIVRSDKTLTIESVKKYCNQYLLDYQIPEKIEFVDTLPKTDVGYPFRRLLREKPE